MVVEALAAEFAGNVLRSVAVERHGTKEET
jgi:hypothetical protein